MKHQNFQSWGRYPKVPNTVHEFNQPEDLQVLISQYKQQIPYGNGRSYGDSALNEELIYMKPHRYIKEFDEDAGVLHCESGLLLSEILDVFVSRGWFLVATPGTKFVTVGGAIASDVHGKNHHLVGAFSDSLIEFTLMLPNGEIKTCSKTKNVELFQATCGGMGLTGVILDVKLYLQPIKSAQINQTTIKTKNLAETFAAFDEYADATYSVAWIDCMAKGDQLGRCLLMLGEHAEGGGLDYAGSSKLNMPIELPSKTLNNYTVKAFNALYYGKVRKSKLRNQIGIDPFFYPLDSITNWNRIYGRNGFTQYQFVLPQESSEAGLTKILQQIASSGKGSFLAVLKLFGKGNENWLSFPKKGYTLALDFKIEASVFELLDKLDDIVVEHGGRIYLAKDGRISRSNFETGYDKIDQFRELREKYQMNEHFNSVQSNRLGL